MSEPKMPEVRAVPKADAVLTVRKEDSCFMCKMRDIEAIGAETFRVKDKQLVGTRIKTNTGDRYYIEGDHLDRIWAAKEKDEDLEVEE